MLSLRAMSLELAYWILGGVLSIFGLLLAVVGTRFAALLRPLPRSRAASIILWCGAIAWFLYHIATVAEVDLAGFPRWVVAALFGGAGLLAFKYLDDLLSLRALGVLALFASNELLRAGFGHTPYSCVLAGTTYLLIIAGMWIGAAPYVLRNFIFKTCDSERFARVAGAVILVVGLANVVNALFFLPPAS